jgi:hypothetical protein
MKPYEVLCIRKEKFTKAPTDKNPSPSYLEVCTVTGEKFCKGIDLAGQKVKPGLYYQLAGYNPKSGFHSAEFIRLPEMDSDELKEETREAIVNLETAIV